MQSTRQDKDALRSQDDAPSPDEDAQGLEVDDAAPKDNSGEEQECRLCSSRRTEINCLMEENRKLKAELSEKQMDEQFLKDDDIKVKYY